MVLFISQNPLNFDSQKVSPKIQKFKNHLEDQRISQWKTTCDKGICFTNGWNIFTGGNGREQ